MLTHRRWRCARWQLSQNPLPRCRGIAFMDMIQTIGFRWKHTPTRGSLLSQINSPIVCNPPPLPELWTLLRPSQSLYGSCSNWRTHYPNANDWIAVWCHPWCCFHCYHGGDVQIKSRYLNANLLVYCSQLIPQLISLGGFKDAGRVLPGLAGLWGSRAERVEFRSARGHSRCPQGKAALRVESVLQRDFVWNDRCFNSTPPGIRSP